jgi:hypothetical protein
MAMNNLPPDQSDDQSNGESRGSNDLELLKVVVTREGQQVSAQWGIHPQMKKDLLPEEWNELNALMAKVTGIVGSRFAEILSEAEPDRPGTA